MIQYQSISSSQVIYVVIEQSTRKQIKQFINRLRFITQTRLTHIQKITNATTKIIELSQAETENDTAKQRGVQQTEQNRIEQNKKDNHKGGECNRSTTKREEVVAGQRLRGMTDKTADYKTRRASDMQKEVETQGD